MWICKNSFYMKSLGKRFQRMGKSYLCTLMPLQIMPVALNCLKKIVTLLDTYYNVHSVQFSSVTQSCLTLWPHELQHPRPPCPSPTPRVQPNSCPLSWWCHPTISFSVIPLSSCLQSFPALGSFPWVSSSHQMVKAELQLQHQS